MFEKKKAPEAVKAQSESPKASPRTVDRLRTMRSMLESQLAKLNQEVTELDALIVWLERFPQAERILETLRRFEAR